MSKLIPCSPSLQRAVVAALLSMGLVAPQAQAVDLLFDFDSAPLHASLPLDISVGGVTAHLSATGQGYSTQPANVLGFTPAGFAGTVIYPNSVFQSDLQIAYSEPMTEFSIMYSPQELGCDDSALMRVSAYRDGAFVATSTTRAPSPGTWPTGTLTLVAPAGFNSVVIHYDTRPICGDWGPIFMADNMIVTTGLIYGDGFE